MEQVVTSGNEHPINTADLVYSNEKTLFGILAFLSGLCWILLIVGTLGMALLYVLLFFIIYLFSQSAFISYLKGSAVEVNTEQLPELYTQYLACCARLDMPNPPKVYLLAADGMLNALATRFLRRNYIVLFSSIVDALETDKDALNFYIGHELGHIRRNHLGKGSLLIFSAWLPLIGPAYARACEYTCDLHGERCCNKPSSATNAVAVLAAGVEQWKRMNVAQYIHQAKQTNGFWMSLHELNASYPWLTKRMARVHARSTGSTYHPPSRHAVAYLLSMCVPRMGNGAGGIIVLAAIIGIMAAIAIPQYKQYQDKANASVETTQVSQHETDKMETEPQVTDITLAIEGVDINHKAMMPVSEAVEVYYKIRNAWPEEPADIALERELPTYWLYNDGILSFLGSEALGDYQQYEIYLVPSVDEMGNISWRCTSEHIPDDYLPEDCQG
ncbi:Zn-dependent protease with chaperone function [Shewanella psychrophila]|uniref:Zn-dependent protease with chaperone function n=1 Tax=Shewanella psychrophila TaxID=225848 RepID=A0A1S6HXU8_9GAMM|nr:M48 family metallopeptidase [Shewanella psychrophila]AQS40329.1 Zn-dependent protease with chaperone function [Shewanella psychrophila]